MASNCTEHTLISSTIASPSSENQTKREKSHDAKPESTTQHKGPSMLLHNVLRRRNSLTLPSKKSSKAASKSKTMKKRESMPVFDKNSSEYLNTTEESELDSENAPSYQRPLPPSPPPSPRSSPLFPIMEQDSKFESQGSGIDRIGAETSSEDQRIKDSSLQSVHDSLTSSEMSLKSALTEFNNHFPLRVKFVEGYCSEDSEHSLSANEVYDIQFVKNTRVITLKDKDGFMHHIPLASTMMFGLVYNPFSDYDEALAGYTFEACSDIITAESMPTVVCATSRVHSQEEKHSIAENEIFVVKGIQKPKLRGKRFLRVFSLLTNAEKLLPEECQGKFSTKPSLVRLHLPQIVNSITNPFPVQAVLYVDNQEPSLKLGFPISGVITLCDCRIETSLVAYAISGEHTEDHVTLHLNDDMMALGVEVLKWKGSVQSLFEEYTPEGCGGDYDDVVVVQKPITDNELYDDIVNTPQGKEVSDDETYATVDMHKKVKMPGEAPYDNVRKEIPLDTGNTNEPHSVPLSLLSINTALQTILTKLNTLEEEVKKISHRFLSEETSVALRGVADMDEHGGNNNSL